MNYTKLSLSIGVGCGLIAPLFNAITDFVYAVLVAIYVVYFAPIQPAIPGI